MTHLAPVSAPTISTCSAALNKSFIPYLGNWSISADPALLKRKSLHLIITPTAPKQHSLADRGSGTSGAKPVLTTHLSRARVFGCTLTLESSISPLRRQHDSEGIIPSFQHWVGDQEPISQKTLVPGPNLVYNILRRPPAHAHGLLYGYFTSYRTCDRCTSAPCPGKSEAMEQLRWSHLRPDKSHEFEAWEGSILRTSSLIKWIKNNLAHRLIKFPKATWAPSLSSQLLFAQLQKHQLTPLRKNYACSSRPSAVWRRTRFTAAVCQVQKARGRLTQQPE